jgi:DNA-3-methyladenine glycosylase
VTTPRFVGFAIDPVVLARRLLGQRLVRVVDGTRLAGIIVETEAYLGAEDLAAHTARGRRTARNESMYLPGGHAYVYFVYGMHYCMNVVAGHKDEGVAVLVRALEPLEGLDEMRRRRGVDNERLLCSGPARLTQALGIDRALDGENLVNSRRLFIEQARGRMLPGASIGISARIGVDYAGAWASRPLRFFIQNSGFISR